MKPVTIPITETRALRLTSVNNLFILVSEIAGEEHETQLTVAETHLLLEAVSQFLAEAHA